MIDDISPELMKTGVRRGSLVWRWHQQSKMSLKRHRHKIGVQLGIVTRVWYDTIVVFWTTGYASNYRAGDRKSWEVLEP